MGSAKDKKDSSGRDKAKCEICGGYYHRVDIHVQTKHGMNAAEYRRQHPGAELQSAYAKEKDKAEAIDESETDSNAALKFGVARLYERKDLTDYDKEFIPLHDEKWVPGPNEIENWDYLALSIQEGENTLIVGPPGVGKSTLVRELAAVCNQPLQRIGSTGELRVRDLFGGKELVEGKTGATITEWRDGPLPDSAEHGHWLLIDEIDSTPSQTTFAMHSAMENPRHLMLPGRANPSVNFHDQFRIIATANTLGWGDSSGLYAGTAPLNEAFLDRFGTVIRMNYPTKENEVKILVERTGVREAVASLMIDVAAKVRESQLKSETMVSLSTRRLIMWASKAAKLSDPMRAAEISVLNRLAQDDAKFVKGLVQRHFGSK